MGVRFRFLGLPGFSVEGVAWRFQMQICRILIRVALFAWLCGRHAVAHIRF